MKKSLLVIVALGLLCMGPSFTRPHQATAASSYTTTKLVPATGGTGAIALTLDNGCGSWTAASNVSWITITSGASGTGPGVVQYTVQPATDPASRSGTITVQGVAYTITQTGLNGTGR